MLRHLGKLARLPVGGHAAANGRSLLDDATTSLSGHFRQLHGSAAALSASPPQPGPQPPATSAASVVSQSGEASTAAVADAQQQGTEAAGGAAAAAAGATAAQQLSQGHQQSWSAVPGVAKVLGLAGLIPFIGLAPPVAAHIPLMPPDVLANAALLQITYGATIASFLGGIHWGAAMLDPRQGAAKAALERYLWGVTPPLMAFPAVLFPGGPGAFIISATLGVCHAVDRSFWRRGLLPPWYMSLRVPLTTLAVGGLGLTIAGDLFSEQQQQQRQQVSAEGAAAVKSDA